MRVNPRNDIFTPISALRQFRIIQFLRRAQHFLPRFLSVPFQFRQMPEAPLQFLRDQRAQFAYFGLDGSEEDGVLQRVEGGEKLLFGIAGEEEQVDGGFGVEVVYDDEVVIVAYDARRGE